MKAFTLVILALVIVLALVAGANAQGNEELEFKVFFPAVRKAESTPEHVRPTPEHVRPTATPMH